MNASHEAATKEFAPIPNPSKPGDYLVLAFEWVGLPKDRPEKPSWKVRHYYLTGWELTRYQWDTGGMENFEVVHWTYLPQVS